MDNQSATPKRPDYIGKICPYCKTAFVMGDEVVVCSACEMPHHKDCWIENQGCTTFGCQGTIRGVDGQTYGQMMAQGARPSSAPHFTASGAAPYHRPVYGQTPGYGAYAPQQAADERSGLGGAPGNPYRAHMPGPGTAQANAPMQQSDAAGQNDDFASGPTPAATFSGDPGQKAAGQHSAAPLGPFCSRCGVRNAADAVFCYECGAKLYRAPAPDAGRRAGAVNPAAPYDAIKRQGSSRPQGQPGGGPPSGQSRVASASNPYDAIPKQGSARGGNPSRPYDGIPKQGAARASGAGAAPGQGSGQPGAYFAQGSAARPAASTYYPPQAGNPYRPAAPGSYPGSALYGQAGADDLPPTPEEWTKEQKLFLQENEAYYQRSFAALKSGQLSWNWAAFFLSSFWLLYRRLYLWGYLTLLGQFILGGMLQYAWPVAPLLVGLMMGLFGNRIYMGHVEQEMNRVRRLSRFNRKIEYSDKGGVRIGQALAMGILSGLFLISLISARL